MSIHLVALGANSGISRASNARKVAQAASALRSAFGGSVRLSSLYATPAWPPGIGPDFVNAAAVLSSALPPAAILRRLHGLEALHGRTRSKRWEARVLDLDLIGSGGCIRPDVVTLRHWIDLPPADQAREVPPGLLLPHPRVQDRGFVLIPLAEVAPGWRHPLTGRTVAAMRDAMPREARRGIRRLYPL